MSFKEKFNAKKALAESKSFLPKGMQYQKEITITETESPLPKNGHDSSLRQPPSTEQAELSPSKPRTRKDRGAKKPQTWEEYQQMLKDREDAKKRKIFEEKIKEEQELKDDPFAEELIMGSEGL
jgi:hypothetical protein